MANKACPKPCYPKMISWFYWRNIRKGNATYHDGENNWRVVDSKFVKL